VIYAISDLHLSGAKDKPMSIFGVKWDKHWDKIYQNWRRDITDDDIVIIPGDISWAMTLEDAMIDLNEIGGLPGGKIILRGNHDFWWSSVSKLKRQLPPSIKVIQNDCVETEDAVICGSRLWLVEQDNPQDQKIFKREILRLQMSLDAAGKIGGKRIIAAVHFPPFNEKGEENEVTALFERYGVDTVIYGHVHTYFGNYPPRVINGIKYFLVSCDALNFQPMRI